MNNEEALQLLYGDSYKSRFVSSAAQQSKKPQGAAAASGAKGLLLDILPFGRIAEKSINPNAGKVTGGELLTEAILSAVPFGLGRAAKVAKAGAKGAKSLTKTDEASRLSKATGIDKKMIEQSVQKSSAPSQPGIKKAFTPAEEGGLLGKVGSRVRGYGRGIISGVKPEGVPDALRPKDAKGLNAVLDSIGAKGGVSNQLEKVGTTKERTHQLINSALTTKNRTVEPNELTSLASRIEDRVAKEAGGFGALPANKRYLDTVMAQMAASSDDVVGLNNFRRKVIDDIINYNRRSGTPDPMSEKVARIFRQELDDFITKAAPDSKKAKSLYSNLEDAERALIVNAPLSLQQAARTGGLLSKVLSSQAVQSGISGTGRMLQGAGKVASIPAVKTGLTTAGTQYLTKNIHGQPQDIAATEETPLSLDITGSSEVPGIEGGSLGSEGLSTGMGNMGQPSIQSPFMDFNWVQENYMGALNAGDYEMADRILKGYQLFQEAQTGGAKATEQQAKMQNAKTIVDNLMNVYQQVGGPRGLYGGTAANVGGFLNVGGEGVERARAYEENRQSYLSPIIKAFGEVGTLTDKDREVLAKALPSIRDTKAQAEQKRQLLYQMIEDLGSGGSNNNLESLLNSYIEQQ